MVEELKIGDMVRTFDGRDVAVKWIGRQTVSTKFGPAERLTPVKVSAGALGENLPTKDLIVTADHALLIGDTLCAAGALVNGTTIARTHDLGETFTVYHFFGTALVVSFCARSCSCSCSRSRSCSTTYHRSRGSSNPHSTRTSRRQFWRRLRWMLLQQLQDLCYLVQPIQRIL